MANYDNALDRAWRQLDDLVDDIHTGGDEEEVSHLKAEALGVATAIAEWYPSRGIDWVRQEAFARYETRCN